MEILDIMKFEIHFSVGDYEDYFIAEGETISDVKSVAKRETEARGLDEKKNNLWSKEIT
jgi:hypothetical protein